MAENMEQKSDRPAALVTDGTKSSRDHTTPSSTDSSKGNKKARDGLHGNKFESKLLTLLCIRGLSAGYKFELGKENEDLAGKFEDVIFRYEVPDETPAGKHWGYQYLQAKHKENENGRRITANDLTDPNRKAPLTLKKYFLTYCKMRKRGDDVRDCIMCTNWDVNIEQFKRIQLEKVKEQHDIFKFAPGEKTVGIYKLKIDRNLRSETIKLLEISDIEAMGMTVTSLADTFEIQFRDEETTNSNEVEMLTINLITEKIVDSKTKKFRPDFVNDENLSVDAKTFRQKIIEVIDDFYSKFLFVVNMPNEMQFKKIIETEDVSKYYPSDTCKIQTTRIFDEISDAFEKKPANFWLTSEEAKKILLAGVTDVSSKYQKQLEEEVEFNEDAIKNMEKKLRHVLDTPGREKIQRIATASPKQTAVKVISAVQILMRELNREGNYLVISSSSLQNEEERKRWTNILKLQKYSYYFFVVVCDDQALVSSYENLITDGNHADDNNFIIIVSRDGPVAGIIDEINYTDLSKYFQEKYLAKTLSFQGKILTVGDLVGEKPEEVIDFSSLIELSFEKKQVKIPSYDTSRFEESLYINRRVKTPFDNHFEDEVSKRLGCKVEELREQCRITKNGHIEWLVEEKRQKEIWDKMKNGADKTTPSGINAEDNQFISFEMERRSIVIISGVAGTGKSTLLSHFYKEIKTKKPDYWVIKMNLVDRSEAIMKWQANQTNAADFFVNYLHETGNNDSSFTNSLLRHRLEKGDRIAIMFDGFDEIDAKCQMGAIQLMKAISKNKSIQLYVTTRPHSVGDLQNELFQFSYTLEIFDMNDQIRYLTQYWETKLDTEEPIEDKKSIIRKFAASLTNRVSQTLRDQERSFIGIPLQCRILAECFQQELKTIIKRNNGQDGLEEQIDFENQLFANVNFDLNSLYERLMETKRRVFREEKANEKASDPNEVIAFAIDFLMKKIESHLTKLAIGTLVTDKKSADTLWPLQSSYHQSETEKTQEEKNVTKFGVKFGLITFKEKRDEEMKPQFLHRTFAEYLFARYLYQGFLLDEKRHNKLLENESIRMLILKKILATWEYHGVQVFFNSMLKELVEGNKEWRNRIDNRDLPERIKKFTENFYDRFLCQELPPQETITRDSGGYSFKTIAHQRFDSENALHFSLLTGNTTIFTFLCDCLDATLDKKQIQNVMMKSFMQEGSYFSFAFFRKTKSKLFKRFINYLNSEADKVMSRLTAFSLISLPPSDLEYSQWNGEEQQETVHHLLHFMTNQREAFDKYFSPNIEFTTERMLTFLIFNENYESHLKIFLGLLSQSTACSDDFRFANFLEKAFCSKKHFISGRIEKVLITLRGLNRQNLLTQLYGIVLAKEPESFRNIYQPLPLERDSIGKDVTGTDLKILMKRDSYRMTRLHRAAFHGNTKAVDKMLGRIRQNLTNPEQNELAGKIINEVMARDEYGFTPFYVAAVRGKEEIYHKMLTFLKQILPDKILEKHWTDPNGFVCRALYDAIESENIPMFNLILAAVKKVLGQNKLLQILRLPKSRYSSSFVSACYKTKKLFYSLAIVVMRDDNATGDTDFKSDFYKLVFEAGLTTEIDQFIAADNHQGKMSFKDFNGYENEYKLFVF